MNKVIKENKHYLLRVGDSVNNTTKLQCYQILNKSTGVIESEFFILPQALVNFDKIEELLESYYTTQSKVEVPSLLKDNSKVTPIFPQTPSA